MHLGDAASWATIIGLPIAVIVGWFTIRTAISKRQRELRGRLREVLREVSNACDDYPVEDSRRTACRAFLKASNSLEVIRDEGILSPKSRYIHYLQITLYDLGTREDAFRSAANSFAMMMSAEEHAQLRPNFDRTTDEMLTYASRVAIKFRNITRRMDNGNIFTYWHYRLLPPFISRKRDTRQWPPVAREE